MQKWLYDLSERISSLQAVLDEADDSAVEADVTGAIQKIYSSDVPDAVYDGISYIREQESLIKDIGEEIDKLRALKKARENRLERVRRGYADFLISIGKKKVETPRGAMSVPAETYKTEVDMAQLPDKYKVTTVNVAPDKMLIKKAILAGENVPGARLIPSRSIRIK